MTRRHPPIWVFPAAVLLVALICGLSLVAGNLAVPQVLHLERLNSPAGTLHVVVIGTSKVRYGIDYDDRFAKRPGVPNGLVFHRITRDAGTPRLLEPALIASLAHPPDLLLIESDLLLVDQRSYFDHPRWSTTWPEFQVYLGHLGQNLALLLDGGPGYDGNEGVDRWLSPPACSQLRQGYAEKAAGWRIARPEAITRFTTLLKQLAHRGTTVVLLDVPVSATAGRLQPVGLRDEAAHHRQQLQAELGAQSWSPPPFPESSYCDLGHFNEDGRKRYSAWLATQIIAWQESRH